MDYLILLSIVVFSAVIIPLGSLFIQPKKDTDVGFSPTNFNKKSIVTILFILIFGTVNIYIAHLHWSFINSKDKEIQILQKKIENYAKAVQRLSKDSKK